MVKLTSLAIAFAILTWVICLNVAHAGCVGGAIGDACIGITVPSPPPDERRYLYEQQPAVVLRPEPRVYAPPPVIVDPPYYVDPD
jgi:hypothetical protein